MEDFYFVYGYEKNKKSARRLYRFIGGEFERYNKELEEWKPSPEQCCIFIGEDWEYDEITEEEAEKIKTMLII
ncbi:MAG: hypothetical protein E7247_05840 [Paenibacillaceae bacterium]|nr:hypothetical protein [Paenibacillaceae bacterium]